MPLVMRISGDGFLRHMVRNIVGTLVDIGLRRRAPVRTVAEILGQSRAACRADGAAAGLFRAVRVLCTYKRRPRALQPLEPIHRV